MSFTRRRFIGGLACSLVAAGLPGCAAVPRYQGIARDDRLILKRAEAEALLDQHGAFLVEADGLADPLILVRLPDGSHHALSAICTHQRCQVRPRRHFITCPCHGSTFDLQGAVVRGPAQTPLPSYPVTLHAETIAIEL